MYIFPFGRRGPSRFFDVFPSPSVRSDIDMYLENVKYADLAIWQFDITFFLRAEHWCSLLCLFEKLESAFPEKDSKGAIEDIGHWALRREAVPLLYRVKAAVFVCGGFPKFLWSDCWELNLLVINAEAVHLPDDHLPAATQLKIQLSLRFEIFEKLVDQDLDWAGLAPLKHGQPQSPSRGSAQRSFARDLSPISEIHLWGVLTIFKSHPRKKFPPASPFPWHCWSQ